MSTFLEPPPLPTKERVDCELARRSLIHFVRQNWRTVETKPFIGGWHLEAIADHLEAVASGHIRQLLINVPPRHSKSLFASVFFPAWAWLHDPSIRFLFSSYAHSLSIRDSVKCRRILQSPRYRSYLQRFQPDFVLMGDQNAKERYDNSSGGYRLATSVDGANTGEGGDIIVVDDPHNVREGESVVKRQAVLEWWDEVMSTRLNSPNGAYVIIMQRVHERDLVGHILSKEHDWDHLYLPCRYEGNDKTISTLGFRDPRTRIDELIWPERYNEEAVSSLESRLGSYATAGQLQQRPAPREGGLVKVTELRISEEFDRKRVIRSVRYWDKAGTEGGGKRTAGVLIHMMIDNSFVVADVVKGQWGSANREAKIKQTAQLDGQGIQIGFEQEPGSGGKESAENTIRNLAGYVTTADRPTGDKATRAEPFAIQAEAGNIVVLNRPWTRAYLNEWEVFPNGQYSDQCDATSGAFNMVCGLGSKKRKRRGGTFGRR